jgi:DNA-binding transcriptional LysR family regulator
MDARDLATFEAVARLGGMGRAARELNTVQSNVTQRVRRLEEALGVSLFERSRAGARLTPAGERLMPYATRVDALLDEALRAARDDGAPRGTLTIGSLETTAALRLSPLLASYVQAHPGVDLVLRTGTTAEMVDRVLGRELEGAFVCGPVAHPLLLSKPAFSEELALLSAPTEATLAAALRRPDLRLVILRAGCSYRQRLEELLARRGVVGLRRLEFGTLEAILGAVAAGLGITLMPRALIGPTWRGGQVRAHRLPAAEARVQTVFVRRRDVLPSSALLAFQKHVTKGQTK